MASCYRAACVAVVSADEPPLVQRLILVLEWLCSAVHQVEHQLQPDPMLVLH